MVGGDEQRIGDIIDAYERAVDAQRRESADARARREQFQADFDRWVEEVATPALQGIADEIVARGYAAGVRRRKDALHDDVALEIAVTEGRPGYLSFHPRIETLSVHIEPPNPTRQTATPRRQLSELSREVVLELGARAVEIMFQDPRIAPPGW